MLNKKEQRLRRARQTRIRIAQQGIARLSVNRTNLHIYASVFSEDGTKVLAKAIAESSAFSIAGGGDTLAAIAKFKIADDVGYISTGGGAFLEFLEGKKLPAIEALEARANG